MLGVQQALALRNFNGVEDAQGAIVQRLLDVFGSAATFARAQHHHRAERLALVCPAGHKGMAGHQHQQRVQAHVFPQRGLQDGQVQACAAPTGQGVGHQADLLAADFKTRRWVDVGQRLVLGQRVVQGLQHVAHLVAAARLIAGKGGAAGGCLQPRGGGLNHRVQGRAVGLHIGRCQGQELGQVDPFVVGQHRKLFGAGQQHLVFVAHADAEVGAFFFSHHAQPLQPQRQADGAALPLAAGRQPGNVGAPGFAVFGGRQRHLDQQVVAFFNAVVHHGELADGRNARMLQCVAHERQGLDLDVEVTRFHETEGLEAQPRDRRQQCCGDGVGAGRGGVGRVWRTSAAGGRLVATPVAATIAIAIAIVLRRWQAARLGKCRIACQQLGRGRRVGGLGSGQQVGHAHRPIAAGAYRVFKRQPRSLAGAGHRFSGRAALQRRSSLRPIEPCGLRHALQMMPQQLGAGGGRGQAQISHSVEPPGAQQGTVQRPGPVGGTHKQKAAGGAGKAVQLGQQLGEQALHGPAVVAR